MDINDTGVAVGYMWDEGDSTAFRWTADGGMSALPSPSRCHTEATAINNEGDIVGVEVVSLFESHALLWQGDEVIDLTGMMASSGWTLLDAMDINDQGWIVGSGVSPDGKVRAYMLVPEPASIILLLLGVAEICRPSRRL